MPSSWEANLDGANEIPGGWLDGHFVQLGYQLAGTVAGVAWSFFLTCLILFVLNLIPGLSLRITPDEEELGLDDVQCGEFAYDYVEVRRHVSDVINGEEPSTTSGAASAHSAELEKPEPRAKATA